MTLEELNELQCTRGWLLSDRRDLAFYLSGFKESGFTMIPFKRGLAEKFRLVCCEVGIETETYVSPYKSFSPHGYFEQFGFLYFFTKGENELKENIIKSLSLIRR